jgi:putative NADH-flavin reductase
MSLTIAVIAANGRSGTVFVLAALAAGHRVRAGIYGQNNLPAHENLTVMSCDATNERDIERLLNGADVVVSLIGHGPKSPSRVQTNAFRVLTEVMSRSDVRRVISLTGTGVRFPGDTPSITDRLANLIIATIDPNRVQDGIEHAKLLQATSLDWTIVRVLKLGDGSHGGQVIFSLHGPAEFMTPRARVATALLQIIESGDYVQQAPIITGKV